MKCPRCQAPNREGVRFCEDCGARLDRLERYNRRLQLMGAVLILGIALLVLPKTRVLEVEKLTIKDASGPRATLGVDEDGRPALRLLDKAGRVIWKAP